MPSPTTGASSWARHTLETTYASTPIAAAAQDFAFISSAMKPAGEEFPADPSLGGMAPKDPLVKLKRGEGDMEIAMRYDGFDNLLFSFFGQVYDETVVETTANERYYYPYPSFTEHAIEGAVTADKRSLQLDLVVPVDATDWGYKFTGAQISSMALAIQNEALQATLSWLSKPPTVITADPTFVGFPIAPLILGGSTAVVTMGDRGSAGATFNMNGGEINIEIPHSNDREFVGSFDMQEPTLNGAMAIGITLNRENQNSDLFADWSADTAKELKITWTGPLMNGTTNYVFEIYFPYCLIGNVGPDISDNGVSLESITLTPYWDTVPTDRGMDGSPATDVATNMWIRTRNLLVSAPLDS